MGKKSKNPKKIQKQKEKKQLLKQQQLENQNCKSYQERYDEIEKIKSKLDELGLSEEHPGIDIFIALAQKYIKTGEGGTGKIKLPGLQRVLNYILTNTKNKKNSVSLEYNKNT